MQIKGCQEQMELNCKRVIHSVRKEIFPDSQTMPRTLDKPSWSDSSEKRLGSWGRSRVGQGCDFSRQEVGQSIQTTGGQKNRTHG